MPKDSVLLPFKDTELTFGGYPLELLMSKTSTAFTNLALTDQLLV